MEMKETEIKDGEEVEVPKYRTKEGRPNYHAYSKDREDARKHRFSGPRQH